MWTERVLERIKQGDIVANANAGRNGVLVHKHGSQHEAEI